MQAEDRLGLRLMRGKQTPGGLEMETGGEWRGGAACDGHIVGSAVSSGGSENWGWVT